MPKFLRHVQFPPHPPAIPTPLRHTHSPLSGAQEGHGSRGLIPLMHTIKSFQTIFFLMKTNSTHQQSEKDVSPTCFYFDAKFI